MAEDEELARHVAQVEGVVDGGSGAAPALSEELDEYRSTASEVHDELARRIQEIDDEKLDESALADVVERLDRLEARIDDLESRL
jgi:uncharacterized protein Yka (UPF0111/DUF47 family)